MTKKDPTSVAGDRFHPFLLSTVTKPPPSPLSNIYYHIVHSPATVFLPLGAQGGKFDGLCSPEREGRNFYLFIYLFVIPKKTHAMWKVVLCWPALQVSSTEERASGTSGVVPSTGWPLSWVNQGAAWAPAAGLWPSEACREANRNPPGNCEVWQQLWNRDQRQQ